jgi:hypothetical protein
VLRSGIPEQTLLLFCFVVGQYFNTGDLIVDGHVLTYLTNINPR